MSEGGLGRRRPRMAATYVKEVFSTAPEGGVRPWNKTEPPAADKQKPDLGPNPRGQGTCEWCGRKVKYLAAHKRQCASRPVAGV